MSEEVKNIEQPQSELSASMPDLKDRVLAAIKTVYDPEIPVLQQSVCSCISIMQVACHKL